MRLNKTTIIFFSLLGLSIPLYLIVKNINYQTNLVEINNLSSVNLSINEAYNERGIYILDNKFYVGENTIIKLDSNKTRIEDDAIWRPKDNKLIPRISDIKSPFHLFKHKNSDTLSLIKDKDTIIILLNK
jgi:hypothetical protein